MSSSISRPLPSDQAQREQALNPANSILVQAPAGSGKTDLLTRRFLRLLVEVEDPGQIVAITFTKAAAAEMRHRILSKLEQAALLPEPAADDAFSMEALAYRALLHSQAMGWNLLDQPAQLRISTIDSFCRDIALQQPLLSGLGDGIDIHEHPEELYRRAARRTIERIDSSDGQLRTAIESLLDWRDNNWADLEAQLLEMLKKRDQWMHEFVIGQHQDWDALRVELERPFASAIRTELHYLCQLLDQVPGACDEALGLARFACEEQGERSPREFAQFAEIPTPPFNEELENAFEILTALGSFLQTQKGQWRSERGLNALDGFPATPRGKAGKARLVTLLNRLASIPGLESALAKLPNLPPVRYSDAEWEILRSCFTLLRNASAELQVVFAEAGAVDYIEVAQTAQRVLRDEDGLPSEAALSLAGRIHHILVDEFQDTSRRQHELLRWLIAAWPDLNRRSCFVVGDPMQSIYFFRDADAELFPRVRISGLEIPGNEPLMFDYVRLGDNFRTAAPLARKLNTVLSAVFEQDDGSGVTFTQAEPARVDESEPGESAPLAELKLHLRFAAKELENAGHGDDVAADQVEEIVALIRPHLDRMERAKAAGKTYRIAVLGRTRASLTPIAEGLRAASIRFRAVDLEKLSARPEIQDVLAMARALLNPLDRLAWLGVLRAPWCGLSLSDLHTLTSADDPALLTRPVPELLTDRMPLLSRDGQEAASRVVNALASAPILRFSQPTVSLGTWLRSVWQILGGEQCADSTARANLDLLWESLDRLPKGEQDLPGPALDAALDKLTAQPDPRANGECGIQLMTIHKSKGLEFEIVIVPELQASTRRNSFKMLSWLERGLPPDQHPLHSEEVTEFLVAPMQSKGSQRSNAKAWVDRVYSERESQEMRRLFYVAATRARDQLHLFARPTCKRNEDGEWIIPKPSGTLLATAWPGLEEEIQQQFEEWKAQQTGFEGVTVETIAAAGENNLLEMPRVNKPTILRRLPEGFRVPFAAPRFSDSTAQVIGLSNVNLYERHEGGILARTLGIAVHSLLEQSARLRDEFDWDEVRARLPQSQAQITAQIRSAGLDVRQANQVATHALEIALKSTHDPTGRWILSPHADAASEARWAGVLNNDVRTVQVDRVFRAGEAPQDEQGKCWWIIDYKTAHADNADPTAFLPQLRALFAPQLQAYASVLRKLHGESTQIHAGLYYPRMLLFDWWDVRD